MCDDARSDAKTDAKTWRAAAEAGLWRQYQQKFDEGFEAAPQPKQEKKSHCKRSSAQSLLASGSSTSSNPMKNRRRRIPHEKQKLPMASQGVQKVEARSESEKHRKRHRRPIKKRSSAQSLLASGSSASSNSMKDWKRRSPNAISRTRKCASSPGQPAAGGDTLTLVEQPCSVDYSGSSSPGRSSQSQDDEHDNSKSDGPAAGGDDSMIVPTGRARARIKSNPRRTREHRSSHQ